jgi:hypothetical protein
MRLIPFCLVLLSLQGCSLWMPRPEPGQAWVDLEGGRRERLQALEVDDAPLDDDRYFQLAPGSHELLMRYRFEVSSANSGLPDALERDCRVALRYDAFAADGRYRLQAGEFGFRPWIRLYDAQGQLLGQGREQGCGSGA